MDKRDKVKAALRVTAISRGAKPDQLTLTVYSNRLAQLDERDVIAALEKLAEAPRGEYEAGLPEIGAVLALVEVERISRENRSQEATTQRLVRWQCTENPAHTMCDFPSAGEPLNRRCQGIPKTRRTDWKPEDGRPICGAEMRVIHDDNDVPDSGPLEPWNAPWAERSGAR